MIKINFHFVSFKAIPCIFIPCLDFENLEDVTIANILRINPQSFAMGVIANNIQYIWLIVVIRNPKMLQPYYDLETPL